MDVTILDSNFNSIAIADTYSSLIWTDRYKTFGDFELVTGVSDDTFQLFRQRRYLHIGPSDHYMIIGKILVKTDSSNGTEVTIAGRSLEWILSKRIVWGLRTFNGNLQEAVKALLTENIISPTIAARKIDNFIFESSTDPRITALTINTQYTGDNLYDVITGLCKDADIGFKITVNDSNQMVFKLYKGTDRSYNQTDNPYVVFSPNFDNLLNSNYLESELTMKNVTLIGGEGDGYERKYAVSGDGTSSGLNRSELFTDARDVSSKIDNQTTLTDAQYSDLLVQRGNEKLSENQQIITFEGKIDANVMYKYPKDFQNGDVVEIENEYGQSSSVDISEIVISNSNKGISIYPTFSTT